MAKGKIDRDKIVRRTALLSEPITRMRGRRFKWTEVRSFRGLKPGTSICTHIVRPSGYESHIYDVYQPKRKK